MARPIAHCEPSARSRRTIQLRCCADKQGGALERTEGCGGHLNPGRIAERTHGSQAPRGGHACRLPTKGGAAAILKGIPQNKKGRHRDSAPLANMLEPQRVNDGGECTWL